MNNSNKKLDDFVKRLEPSGVFASMVVAMRIRPEVAMTLAKCRRKGIGHELDEIMDEAMAYIASCDPNEPGLAARLKRNLPDVPNPAPYTRSLHDFEILARGLKREVFS